eukprot:GHVN01030910.1.p1 GENE.GHVN01030910.1~~GHVN01030910.1.p1  ORF type:complete len:155 (-),score=7.74 GHVN01030910.1:230-694(-)
MEYCCHLWDGATGTERLDKIQKRCCSYMGHRENTIASMNIQSLQHRRRVADLTIYYKMVSKLAPQAVCELLPEIDLRRTTVRTDAVQQREVNTYLKRHYYLNSFVPRFKRCWNLLPASSVPDQQAGPNKVIMFKKTINKMDLTNLPITKYKMRA